MPYNKHHFQFWWDEDEDGKIHGQTINPSMKVFNSKKNEEIAKKLGISRSYVSRIEKSALEKLRKQF